MVIKLRKVYCLFDFSSNSFIFNLTIEHLPSSEMINNSHFIVGDQIGHNSAIDCPPDGRTGHKDGRTNDQSSSGASSEVVIKQLKFQQ